MHSVLVRQIDEVTELLAARRFERTVAELKYEFAALRLQAAMLRHFYVCRKAGFRPSQPRWPKGTPDQSGRWSGGSGTGATNAGTNSAGRSRGHHFVPGELYRHEPLRPETRKVFEDNATGPLRGQMHGNSREHMEYNKAVQEAFDNFKAKNGIARSEDVTPEQAKEFVGEIKASADPRIHGLNMRIFMQEFQFYLRRIPRRID
jgi:hypothetical protein